MVDYRGIYDSDGIRIPDCWVIFIIDEVEKRRECDKKCDEKWGEEMIGRLSFSDISLIGVYEEDVAMDICMAFYESGRVGYFKMDTGEFDERFGEAMRFQEAISDIGGPDIEIDGFFPGEFEQIHLPEGTANHPEQDSLLIAATNLINHLKKHVFPILGTMLNKIDETTEKFVVLGDRKTWSEIRHCHIIELKKGASVNISYPEIWDGYKNPYDWAVNNPDKARVIPLKDVLKYFRALRTF